MKESKYAPVILEELKDGAASIGTLKEKCGQGSKITNIRKALYQLLKNGLVEVNGYNLGCKNFNYDCIMLKKVETDIKNPIYVKGLLDNPLQDDNYFKIQQLFKRKIEEINQIYNDEIKEINEIEGIMSLKKAIELNHVKTEDIYSSMGVDDSEGIEYGSVEATGDPKIPYYFVHTVTIGDVLERDPQAQIYYLKKHFSSELIPTSMSLGEFPYFKMRLGGGRRYRIDFDDGRRRPRVPWPSSFLNTYKNYLDHLPVNTFMEQALFNYFIIGALRAEEKSKDEVLWKLSMDLTENKLYLFVNKLRVIEQINDTEYDNMEYHLRI